MFLELCSSYAHHLVIISLGHVTFLVAACRRFIPRTMRHTLSHEIAWLPSSLARPSLRDPLTQDLPWAVEGTADSPFVSHSGTFYRSPPLASGRVSRSSARTRHTLAATRPVHTHPATPRIPFSLFLPYQDTSLYLALH